MPFLLNNSVLYRVCMELFQRQNFEEVLIDVIDPSAGAKFIVISAFTAHFV